MTTDGHQPLNLDRPLRGRIYDSIVETIGNTPLVRIPRIAAEEGITADICLKLEFFNPIASVKDRIGVNMILALEADGRLKPGGTVIEPTSGNTGIALAFMCAARGYKLILTMPESMSIERRKMLAYLGAELVADAAREGHERRHRPRQGIAGGDTRLGDSPTSSATRPIRQSTSAPRRRKSGTTPRARSMRSSPASAPAAR